MRGLKTGVAVLLAGSSLQPSIAAAQTGFNGVVVWRTLVNGQQETETQTTKGRKARFDYTCPSLKVSCTMIVDADARVSRMIRHDKKQYLTITETDAKQLDAIRPMLEPTFSERMKQRKLEGGDWSKLWGNLKFENTGRTEIVAGVPCEVWLGRDPAGSNDKGEACIAAAGTGIALQQVMSAIVGDSQSADGSVHGLPPEGVSTGLLKLSLVKEGSSPTLIEAIKVEPKTVDDDLFAPPVGYAETRMADDLSYLQSQMEPGELQGSLLSPRPGDTLSYPRADDPRVSSPPSLQWCAWDSLYLGYLRASGEFTYRVSAEGISDTASLVVEKVNGTDQPTLRAALQRVLAVCRFRPVLDTTAIPTLMRQQVRFAASAPPFIAGSIADPAQLLRCDPKNPNLVGSVTLEFVVGWDGLPEPGSIRALNATSPEIERIAPTLLDNCQFRPARVNGAWVRSLVRIPFTLRN